MCVLDYISFQNFSESHMFSIVLVYFEFVFEEKFDVSNQLKSVSLQVSCDVKRLRHRTIGVKLQTSSILMSQSAPSARLMAPRQTQLFGRHEAKDLHPVT